MRKDPAGMEQAGENEVVLRGIGVSMGVAVGQVFLKSRDDDHIVERDLAPDEVPREIARFESALIATRQQLREFQKNSDPAVAGIFDAHLLILDDRPFVERVVLGIEEQRKNVEVILSVIGRDFVKALSQVNDEYLRERTADVDDVVRRIFQHLTGRRCSLADITENQTIIVSSDLSPSETVSINRDKVVGIALDLGSPTSHAAILAGKLNIPTVVGLHDISLAVKPGDRLLVDGGKGLVILHPSAERLEQYNRIAETRRSIETGLARLKDQPAITRDGYRVVLSANIELPDDINAVVSSGAEGVGLFRTEYFYMSRKELPSEDEQFEAYREVATRLSPSAVIIRTLDLGGDKFLANLNVDWDESNPFMGWRAIRFCLAQPDLFRTQLKAILRASACGNVKIMYPMISNLEEVARANVILDQAKRELMARGYPFDPHIEVGVMIEVPSAAMVADLLAPYVKFFSLGTNDLIQYTLAIDRGNERVAYLYEPTHPSILRLIKNTIDVGHRHGIWTGICGSMAGDPLMAPLLVGLGIDEMSMNPPLVPVIKDEIRNLTYSDAREIAESAMASQSTVDVQDLSRQLTNKIAPEILELVD